MQPPDAPVVHPSKWIKCALCPRTKTLIAFCNLLACAWVSFPFLLFLSYYRHIYSCEDASSSSILLRLVYRLIQNMNWNYSTLTWLTRSVELLHKNPSYRLHTYVWRDECTVHTHILLTHLNGSQPILALKMIRLFFFPFQAIPNRSWHFPHWIWNMLAILMSFFVHLHFSSF